MEIAWVLDFICIPFLILPITVQSSVEAQWKLVIWDSFKTKFKKKLFSIYLENEDKVDKKDYWQWSSKAPLLNMSLTTIHNHLHYLIVYILCSSPSTPTSHSHINSFGCKINENSLYLSLSALHPQCLETCIVMAGTKWVFTQLTKLSQLLSFYSITKLSQAYSED